MSVCTHMNPLSSISLHFQTIEGLNTIRTGQHKSKKRGVNIVELVAAIMSLDRNSGGRFVQTPGTQVG